MQEKNKQLNTKKKYNDDIYKIEIMKNQTPETNSQGQKILINFEDNKDIDNVNIITPKKLERTDSIKLYKRHKKENKKVTFIEPDFFTIIDVESYKKFNAENTCKDPFEDMDFLNNINNLNNININNNNKKNEENDGKERINCSCLCNIC